MRSNTSRAAAGAVVIVLAVVLFFVLRDDGGDSGDTEQAPQQSPATTTGPTTTGPTTTGTTGPDRPPVQTIEIADGAPVGGVQEIEATTGDQVRFRVVSDVEADVHIHGYDIEEVVEAGGSLLISFPAEIDGGYEVEVHSHSAGEFEIAKLTVRPG